MNHPRNTRLLIGLAAVAGGLGLAAAWALWAWSASLAGAGIG